MSIRDEYNQYFKRNERQKKSYYLKTPSGKVVTGTLDEITEAFSGIVSRGYLRTRIYGEANNSSFCGGFKKIPNPTSAEKLTAIHVSHY